MAVNPSELLIHCMEEFGKSEPTTVMVCWINEEGRLSYRASSTNQALNLGMLEVAKTCILKKIV